MELTTTNKEYKKSESKPVNVMMFTLAHFTHDFYAGMLAPLLPSLIEEIIFIEFPSWFVDSIFTMAIPASTSDRKSGGQKGFKILDNARPSFYRSFYESDRDCPQLLHTGTHFNPGWYFISGISFHWTSHIGKEIGREHRKKPRVLDGSW